MILIIICRCGKNKIGRAIICCSLSGGDLIELVKQVVVVCQKVVIGSIMCIVPLSVCVILGINLLL